MATTQHTATSPPAGSSAPVRAWLPLGGVAIAGRSGSGKSSMFFGSEHVRCAFIADTGSQGHKLYQRPGGEVRYVDLRSNEPPSVQVMACVQKWSDAGRLWVLDSFTTVIEHECVYAKRGKKSLFQADYKDIVGRMRDLALVLAQLPGFTVFNTAPGGMVKLPDGTVQDTPKGSIVGLPALTGVGSGSETILARWSTSYVVFPGHTWTENGRITRSIPRGFILPNKDLRGSAANQYTPIKDPLNVLAETVTGEGDQAVGLEVDAFRPMGEPSVDVILERIARKFPPPAEEPAKKPGRAA